MKAISTAVAAFLVAVADVPEGLRPWQPAAMLAIVAAALAVATRAHRPVGAVVALATLTAVALGAEVVGEPGQVSFGHYVVIAVLIADVARHCTLPVVAMVGATALVSATLTEGLADERGPGDVLFVTMMWALAASTALAVRWRVAATDARDQRVKTGERERIARELHDVVAHHVSAIALTAEGARTFVGADDEKVDGSLSAISAAAVAALDEMREMVMILRDGSGAAPPMRLDALVDALQSDDRPRVGVSIDTGGAEPPRAVVAAVHRIAREAVTNSRRHARDATSVNVDIAVDDSELVLTVSDDGRGSAPSLGGGFGLAGMTERAELLGGSCVAGLAAAGGWRVVARLPMERRS